MIKYSACFFEESRLTEPNVDLIIGGNSHGAQAGKIVTGLID